LKVKWTRNQRFQSQSQVSLVFTQRIFCRSTRQLQFTHLPLVACTFDLIAQSAPRLLWQQPHLQSYTTLLVMAFDPL
jgi:hypothetical protein